MSTTASRMLKKSAIETILPSTTTGVKSGHHPHGMMSPLQQKLVMKHSSASTIPMMSSTGGSVTSELVRKNRNNLQWFYDHPAIDAAAEKPSVRLTPAAILYTGRSGDEGHALKTAQYLHKELPVRVAHRVAAFRFLPFIVGCNPIILAVHELYIGTFYLLSEFPSVTESNEKEFAKLIRILLDDHKDVVTQLSEGFKECRKYIDNENVVKTFLDRTLTSRLGMRILAENYLGLRDQKQSHVGAININMKPKDLIDRWCSYVTELSEQKYGKCPAFKLNGHLDASFPYIEAPLDYILPELLKFAIRSTIEAHLSSPSLPPIIITIANNDADFIIRISDRGGGIDHDKVDKVGQYHFSTAGSERQDSRLDGGILGNLMSTPQTVSTGFYGYGFGLPTAKAYAEYLGGSLDLVSMQGIGTDAYLRLKHIDGKHESFRI